MKVRKKIAKREDRERAREMLKITDQAWRLWASQALLKATRAELLRKIQPGVAGKAVRKAVTKQVIIQFHFFFSWGGGGVGGWVGGRSPPGGHISNWKVLI